MARKKKKNAGKKGASSTVEQLGALLAGEEAAPEHLAAQCGLDADTFGRTLERARQLARAPDPRQILELPACFQQAFLHFAVIQQDEDLLGDLLSMASDREVKKEARRLLHKLRSRGVAVDIAEPARASVLDRQPENDEPELDCYLSPPEANGTVFLWLARYTHGGVAVCQAAFDDVGGLEEFNGGVVGRNAYRRMVKDLIDDKQLPLRSISYAVGRAYLARAVEQAKQAGRALPEEYLKFSGELPAVEGVELGDARAEFPRPPADELEQLLQHGEELFELEEFSSWGPGEEDIEALGKKFEEIEASTVIVSEAQRLEQIESAIEKFIAGLVEGERRGLLAGRLFEMARFLKATGRDEPARLCAAVAWSLEAEDFSPGESRFLERLARRHLKPTEEIMKGMKPLAGAAAGPEAAESSSNLVTP